MFRAVHSSLAGDIERPNWITLEIAGIQADLALFEEAQKEGVQLPWLPAIEQTGGLSMPVAFNHDDQTIYDRFTVLCTMMRHQVYRKHWQAAIRTYKGLLEISQAPLLQKAVAQLALHGCFIRLISALLAADSLHQAFEVCKMTVAKKGAGWVNARILSRILLSTAPRDTLNGGSGETALAAKLFVPCLRLIREWAQERQASCPSAAPLIDIDEGKYTTKTLRSVLSDYWHLDRLSEAALAKLFRMARTTMPLEAALEPFRELLDTLLAINADVVYRRWWERLERQMAKRRDLNPIARARWMDAAPRVREMISQAEQQYASRQDPNAWMQLLQLPTKIEEAVNSEVNEAIGPEKTTEINRKTSNEISLETAEESSYSAKLVEVSKTEDYPEPAHFPGAEPYADPEFSIPLA